ncbi:hypothetical protein [Derxia gummosa]|uniref:Uncharacterized protein n=1 Tax=Derxia gummosa DSM 723 TaxID=1121388 RepID=A0A8B6XCT1_9BURK|nr:hypothetical protein [Derxia gummosa]
MSASLPSSEIAPTKLKFLALGLGGVAALVGAPAHAQSCTVRQNLVVSNYYFVDLDPDDGIDASGSDRAAACSFSRPAAVILASPSAAARG